MQNNFSIIFWYTNCFILLVTAPFMYLIKAIIGVANYTDEQGKIYCDHLRDLYKALEGNQEDS